MSSEHNGPWAPRAGIARRDGSFFHMSCCTSMSCLNMLPGVYLSNLILVNDIRQHILCERLGSQHCWEGSQGRGTQVEFVRHHKSFVASWESKMSHSAFTWAPSSVVP